MKTMQTGLAIALLLTAVHATEPPDLMNYQGVLRGSGGQPLDGSYEIVFRYWDADTGGDEIMVERHTTIDSTPVTVSDGMFNVELGSGSILDGSGPDSNGPYTSLQKVFKNYQTVWLEIEVGGEVMSPRVRVRTAAYAFNAMHLGGRRHNQYLNDSNLPQTKLGELLIDTSVEFESTAVKGLGTTAGGYFEDSTDSSYCYAGYNAHGVWASGQQTGGRFENASGTGTATLAQEDVGMTASGDYFGGLFTSPGSSTHLAVGPDAIQAAGIGMGGYFQDVDDFSSVKVAYGQTGIEAWGAYAGGVFVEQDGTGLTLTAYNDMGIHAQGTYAGGRFFDSDGSGDAWVGRGDYGIEATGSDAGAYFGTEPDDSYVYLALGGVGTWSRGYTAGGFFKDRDDSGEADIGIGDFGIDARGKYQSFGIGGGGRFADTQYSGVALVGHGNEGIYAQGITAGGEFRDSDSGGWGQVGRSTYKIFGSGAVSFVQNHPDVESKVVVYHAPEASEVAVYTRGSGRLSDGVATVELDETFQWVANPDLGLTAHLTPRGLPEPLAVESLSTTELVVRGPDDADAAFDFLVYGLRIGFEEVAPVQAKEQEAFIPAMDDHVKTYNEDADARRFNAFERFAEMTAQVKGVERSSLDLTGSGDLIARIGRYDHELHAVDLTSEPQRAEPIPPGGADSADAERVDEPASAEDPIPIPAFVREVSPESTAPVSATWLPVAEPIEQGDVLALDPDRPGSLARASSIAYPQVVGIAAGPVQTTAAGDLEALLAGGRYTTVRVDAGYGAILPGDTLVASPTPGHAMRELDPGASFVLGKTLEGLESGQGQVRVLLILR